MANDEFLKQQAETFTQDPRFQKLPKEQQRGKLFQFLNRIDNDPQFRQGFPEQQGQIPSRGTQPEPGSRGGVAVIGQFAQGFNDVFEGILTLPVAAVDEAFNLAGIQADNESFAGSIKAHLERARHPLSPFEGGAPQGTPERVARGTGGFLGETVIGFGAALKAGQGINALVQSENILPARLADAGLKEKTKRLGKALAYTVESLAKSEHPEMLLLADVVAGTTAGATGELLAEAFPENSELARSYGQLAGAFGPDGIKALSMAILRRSAGPLRKGVFGLTNEEIQSDISQRLQHAYAPELRDIDRQLESSLGKNRQELLQRREGVLDRIATQTDEMMNRVEDLREEFGVDLTFGQAADVQGLTLTQRNVEGFTPPSLTRFKDRMDKNVDNIVGAVLSEAPEGTPGAVDRFVKNFHQNSLDEWNMKLSRAQAEIDVAQGKMESRNAAMLEDAERVYQQVETRALNELERLRVRPDVTPKRLGQVLRDALDIELAEFRAQFTERYGELTDQMQRIRVPTNLIRGAVEDLNFELTPDVTSQARIPERLMNQINNLGTDYRLSLQAQHALADLGAAQAGGRGTKIFDFEVGGQGGTAEITGVRGGMPEYLRDLKLNKNQLAKALQALSTTQVKPKNMEMVTWDRVKDAIQSNTAFQSGPFNDPDMLLVVGDQPSVTFETLKNLRSDILTESRFAVAAGNHQLNRRLEILMDSVEEQMAMVGENPDYAGVAGDLHARWREVSTAYRNEVVRLKQGTLADMKRRDLTGRYRRRDEELASSFLANETSMDEFVGALGNHEDAAKSLDHMLKIDFIRKFYDPRTKSFRTKAADAWIANKAHVWHHFPEFREKFADTTNLMASMQQLKTRVDQVETLAKKPEEFAKLFKNLDIAERDKAIARLDDIRDQFKLFRSDFQKNLASEFLRADVEHVAMKAILSKDPNAKIRELFGFLGTLPDGVEAQNGMKRALFDVITAKIQPDAAGARTPRQLATALRKTLIPNEKWMVSVFGQEKMTKLKDAMNVLESLAITDSPVQRGTSETAINLVNMVNELSPWLSRTFAVAGGRVPWLYGVMDRVLRTLNRGAVGRTTNEVHRLMEETFFDPEVARTMLQLYRGGDPKKLHRRIRGHIMAMGGSAFEGAIDPDQPEERPQIPVVNSRELSRIRPESAGLSLVR